MSDLPKGWEWTTLEAIAAAEPRAMTDGPFGSNLKSSHYVDSGPRVIRLQNIGFGSFNDEHAHITESHFENLRAYEARAGDLVVASLGQELPRSCLVPPSVGPAIVKADCIRVRLHPEVAARYVDYSLQRPALRRSTTDQVHGVGRPRLGMAGIRQLSVPLAPRAEQDRIVAAIEEHLSRLGTGVEAADSAERRLRLFEESVEAQLLAGGWRSMRLDALADLVTDGDHRPPPRVPAGIPHLTAKHVRSGQLSFDGCTFVSEEGYRQTSSRYEPQAGDVIVTCVGTVGNVAVVPSDVRFSADRNLAAVRLPTDSHVRPEWVAAVLGTARYRRLLMGASGSTAQPHLYLKDLRMVEIPIPPKSTQDDLLTELRGLKDRGSRLNGSLHLAGRRSESLRRSILAAAFSGRLVPQDSADEPASVLLARIRADRRATLKPGRRRPVPT